MLFKKLKRIKTIRKKYVLSKRQKFVFVTLILTLIFLLAQTSTSDYKFRLIFVLIFLNPLLVGWVLKEDLKGVKIITTLTLPTMFSVATAFFYLLLPPRWLTRLPMAVFYALGIYAILLTENIYNVATIRSIQLLRVAHSVGFLLTLVTSFLLFNLILTLHLSAGFVFLLVFITIFILSLQSLWSIKLEEKISKKLCLLTLSIALTMAQVAFIFSFWPIRLTIWALFLATLFYTLVGIGQHHLLDRLFKKTINEFIGVLIIVFLLIVLTTRWGVRY